MTPDNSSYTIVQYRRRARRGPIVQEGMMACCALAVFLIGQLYAVIDWTAGRLGLRRAAVAAPGAADWRLQASPTVLATAGTGAARPAWFRRRRLRVAAALAVSASALGVLLAGPPLHDTGQDRSPPMRWCGDGPHKG